jgi:photosystem II stability/assembly factor-like uncharacterized protein
MLMKWEYNFFHFLLYLNKISYQLNFLPLATGYWRLKMKLKKILIVLIPILVSTQLIKAQSGWYWQNPKFTNLDLEDIVIINSSTAYSIGGYSTFIKTTDAGLTWSNGISSSEKTGMTPERLFALSFINSNTGWAVGYNNTQPPLRIFKTTNAGSSWFRQGIELGNAYLQDVFFINENTGWISANNSILRTTNSGVNWAFIQLPNNGQMFSVFFVNENTGYTSGDYRVYKTTDSGLTWNISYYNSASENYCIRFINQNTGFIAGRYTSNARILKTTNGGNNWQVKYEYVSYSSRHFQSIYTLTQNEMIAVGGDFNSVELIIKSYDTGETWNEINTNIPNPEILITTAFFNQYNGLAFGYNGKMLRTSNSGLNWVSINPNSFDNYVHSVKFSNNQTGWLLSDNGKILKTSDGGYSWVILDVGTTSSLIDGFFFSNLYYTISNNKFFRSSNAGLNWQSTNFDRTIPSFDFIDQNTGYILGKFGNYDFHCTLMKTTDSGLNWDTTGVNILASPTIIKFLNAQTGFIVGGSPSAYVYKTINAGLNWNQKYSGVNKLPESICFANQYTGWISCEYNAFLKTTDAGESWQLSTFGMPGSWTSPKIQFTDINTGWVIINHPSAQVLKSTNGGLNWNIQFDCGVSYLTSLFFNNENTGWIAGDGFLLRTTNGGTYLKSNILSTITPNNFMLFQNFPNPFNPSTKIRFSVPSGKFDIPTPLPPFRKGETKVSLKIYDILGREVSTLVNEQLKPGTYDVEWDGSNFSSGVYYYKLVSGDFVETKKMVLLK